MNFSLLQLENIGWDKGIVVMPKRFGCCSISLCRTTSEIYFQLSCAITPAREVDKFTNRRKL
jgi:hypothetical protein